MAWGRLDRMTDRRRDLRREAAVSDWQRILLAVLAVTVIAAWMERFHPATICTEQCGVAGLTTSCGAVAR